MVVCLTVTINNAYYLRPSSWPMLKMCPNSWAAVLDTDAKDIPVSCTKPAEILPLHIEPIEARPVMLPSKSMPLQHNIEN